MNAAQCKKKHGKLINDTRILRLVIIIVIVISAVIVVRSRCFSCLLIRGNYFMRCSLHEHLFLPLGVLRIDFSASFASHLIPRWLEVVDCRSTIN